MCVLDCCIAVYDSTSFQKHTKVTIIISWRSLKVVYISICKVHIALETTALLHYMSIDDTWSLCHFLMCVKIKELLKLT